MFAQQLTRDLAFAGTTAAQGIEECEKFVEEQRSATASSWCFHRNLDEAVSSVWHAEGPMCVFQLLPGDSEAGHKNCCPLRQELPHTLEAKQGG